MNMASERLEDIGIYSNPQDLTDKQRIEYINELMKADNIVDLLERDELDEIIQQVKMEYSDDEATMSSWRKSIKDGMKLIEFEMESKSIPWEGSANFKTPRSLAFGLAFGDRAASELLKGPSIVKTQIFGKDPGGDKEKRSQPNTPNTCLLYTSPSPRDRTRSRMPSSA